MALAELADDAQVLDYLRTTADLPERLDLRSARCRLIHTGPLNRVFEVRRDGRGIAIVKQALPYLRADDEEWPLEHRHALFERRALEIQQSLSPGLVPEVYHSDVVRGILVLEHLDPLEPLQVHVVDHQNALPPPDGLVRFCVHTLFRTSDFFLTTEQKMVLTEFFAPNMEVASFLHRRLFVEPLLDPKIQQKEGFPQVLEQVAQLSHAFLSRSEVLCHGGLTARHILTDGDSTRIISPTYAFLGPAALDPGVLTGQILRLGMLQNPSSLQDTIAWVERFWTDFSRHVLDLWRLENHGDATPGEIFDSKEGAEILEAYRTHYMRDLVRMALGIAGCQLLACATHSQQDPPLRSRLESAGFACLLASGQAVDVAQLREVLGDSP